MAAERRKSPKVILKSADTSPTDTWIKLVGEKSTVKPNNHRQMAETLSDAPVTVAKIRLARFAHEMLI